MKNFFMKYKVVIAIVVLLGLFILLSVLVDEKEPKVNVGDSVTEWVEEIEKDQYVVAVLAQTTCSHCIAFKPVMTKVQKENGFKLFWFELDTMSKYNKEDYSTLMNKYELDGYQGTPYTFITKNGEFVDYISGERDESALVEFLKNNNVIE